MASVLDARSERLEGVGTVRGGPARAVGWRQFGMRSAEWGAGGRTLLKAEIGRGKPEDSGQRTGGQC